MSNLQARWKLRLAPWTVYNQTKALAKVVTHFDRECGTNLSAFVLRARPGRTRRVTATPEELAALLRHARPHEKVWLLIQTLLALRRSDALRLAPQHYYAEAGEIRITQAKTGEPLVLPVPDVLREYFDNVPAGTPPETPFIAAYAPHRRGAQADVLYRAWRRLRRRAGVNPQLKPHDLRRTAGTALMNWTKDIRAVQQFLGHKNLASTAHYIAPIAAPELRAQLEAVQRITLPMQTEKKQ